MVKSKTRSIARRATLLGASLDKALHSYCMAAGAAGVGLMALAQPAAAQIIYTPAHQQLYYYGSIPIDLNHDGIYDVTVLVKSINSNYGDAVDLSASGGIQHNSVIKSPSANSVLPLQKGAPIGSSGNFFAGGFMAGWGSRKYGSGGASGGLWLNVKNRYLGIRFKIDGQEHYGWARFSVTLKGSAVFAFLNGYAYNAVPDQRILAGQTSEEEEGQASASEPATLGRLALGALGLAAWKDGK